MSILVRKKRDGAIKKEQLIEMRDLIDSVLTPYLEKRSGPCRSEAEFEPDDEGD